MIGFFIGTACLIGLFKVLGRTRGFAHWGHCGHAMYGGPFDGSRHGWGWGPRRRHGGGFGRSLFFRGLFMRLDTTPGQEKVIATALDELKSTMRAARAEMKEARADFARAMRGESFDEVALGGATACVENVVDTARKAAIAAFAKVHEALDERQRHKLADLIESGPGFGRWSVGHDDPYTHAI